MHRSRRHQAGQGLIELALVLPILIMMMAAAGYFGFAITAKQRLTIAARQAARAVAAQSSEANRQGFNRYVAGISMDTYRTEAASALTGFNAGRITFRAPDWKRQGLIPLSDGAALMIHQASPGRTAPAFRVGAVFYGCVIEYRLKELDWLATLMGLGKTGLPISAVCVMPGELPMRGVANVPFGLLDLNQGLIGNAVTNPLNDPTFQNLPPLVPVKP
jgi:type II secretory pathway pseudopilin PulG